jgi:hypothetical protein
MALLVEPAEQTLLENQHHLGISIVRIAYNSVVLS